MSLPENTNYTQPDVDYGALASGAGEQAKKFASYLPKSPKAVNLSQFSGLRNALKPSPSPSTPSIPASPSFTPQKTGMRTDRNNNPTAMTTDVANTLGLKQGVDYAPGDPFSGGVTARLMGDPVAVTIKALDNAALNPSMTAFYTKSGQQRWTHTAVPDSQWLSMSPDQKRGFVAEMYKHEGGSGELMKSLPQTPAPVVQTPSYTTIKDKDGKIWRYSALNKTFIPDTPVDTNDLAMRLSGVHQQINSNRIKA